MEKEHHYYAINEKLALQTLFPTFMGLIILLISLSHITVICIKTFIEIRSDQTSFYVKLILDFVGDNNDIKWILVNSDM